MTAQHDERGCTAQQTDLWLATNYWFYEVLAGKNDRVVYLH